MVTARLKNIVLASVCVFIAHGIEEWATGFFAVDPTFSALSRLAKSETEAIFVGYQLAVWVLLMMFWVMLLGHVWRMRALALFGILLIAETEHLVVTIARQSYYPGSVTAALFIPLAIAFWHEFWQLRKRGTVNDLVTDPICGLRLLSSVATETVNREGRVVCFCSQDCKSRYLESEGATSH